MQKIRRLLVALFCLLVGAVVLLFTLENRQSVKLEFLSHLSPEMPLAVAILLAFILGAVLTTLLFWWPLVCQKSKARRLQRKLDNLTEKLQQSSTNKQELAVSAKAVAE